MSDDNKKDPNQCGAFLAFQLAEPPTPKRKGPPVLAFETIDEEGLDEAIELGRELALLRRAKETSIKAALLIQAKLNQTRNLIAGIGDLQAEASLPLLDEALASVAALLLLLKEGDQ